MDAEGLVAMVTKLSVALRTFQRTSMSTYTRVAVAQTKQLQDIITAGNFSLLELAPVMVAIEESGFPEESKMTLQASTFPMTLASPMHACNVILLSRGK